MVNRFKRGELSDRVALANVELSNLVFNVFGAIGVPQCAYSLIVVVVGRTTIRAHDGLGVAAEGVCDPLVK